MNIDSKKPDQKTLLTTKTFAAKYRNKSEIYRFIVVDVGYYLAHPDCHTIY